MKKITTFNIDTTDLTVNAASRQYIIDGEDGAEFILQVFNSSQQFYDFSTKSFSSAFTSTSSLDIKMDDEHYRGTINFPANDTGDTYTILLLTPPDKDTILDLGRGKYAYSTTITQQVNVTLTFTTSSGTSDAYGTPPTVTSTATPISTALKTVDWTLTNSETDANGFGFRLSRQPVDTDWYFTTSDTVNNRLDNTIEEIANTVNGAVSNSTGVLFTDPHYLSAGGAISAGDYVFLSSGTGAVTLGTTVASLGPEDEQIVLSAEMSSIGHTARLEFITATAEIILDDLTDIKTGMVISAVSGTNSYLIGTPYVEEIYTETNTIVLSTAQAFVDGITLTFQARGSSVIKKAIGVDIDFTNWNSDFETVGNFDLLTKKIRATGTNTVIALDNTYGLTGGGHTSIKGLNVVNTSANTIQSVSADADGEGADGTITVQLNQTAALAVGTVVTFPDTTTTFDIDNEIKIISHGLNNRTIYLNLDNFITLGTAS
jgi:hypothetical protein